MIPFEPSFFEEEVRSDFLIDRTMKTCWAAEMELLFDIDQICEKYNIQYFVYFGSLLGAIRHKGFVPWDDDLDIAMKREDFERFMEIAKDELPSDYVISNPLTGENATEFWASVRNGNTISIDPKHLEKNHGCPFIVGIDIFQLDYLPRNPQREKEHTELFHYVWSAVRLVKKSDKDTDDVNRLSFLLNEIETKCKQRFECDFELENEDKLIKQLIVLANQIAASVKRDESDEMVTFISFENHREKRNPKEFFDEVIWVPFENINVPVPSSWELLLPRIYKNYMVPRRFTQKHDYPFYKQQIELVRQKYEEMLGEKKF